MTATSAASTLGTTWNRLRNLNETPDLQPQPLPLGARFAPPPAAALGLPIGRILLAIDDAETALHLQRMLHQAGFLVIGPVTTIPEVQARIQRGDIDCVILDLDVDRRAPLPIADLLAFADVPFVYLATGVTGFPPARHRHRPVVEKPFTRQGLLAAVEQAMAKARQIVNEDPWRMGAPVVPRTRVYPSL